MLKKLLDLIKHKPTTDWNPLPGKMPKKNRWVLLYIDTDCWGERKMFVGKRIRKRSPSEMSMYDTCPISREWVIPSLPAYAESKATLRAWTDLPTYFLKGEKVWK